MNKTIYNGLEEILFIKNNSELWLMNKNDGSKSKIMENVKSIISAERYFIVLKNDKSLWGWDNHIDEDFGGGYRKKIDKPIKIIDNVVCAVTADEETLALKEDNTLWMWIVYAGIQVCDGYMNEDYIPRKIAESVKKMYLGGSSATMIKQDDSLWLIETSGISDRFYEPKLKKIMSDVENAQGYFYHYTAIKKDKTLWTWGLNDCGQLGDGTLKDREIPKQIMTDTKSIYLSYDTVSVIKNDDSLWQWGEIYTPNTKGPDGLINGLIKIFMKKSLLKYLNVAPVKKLENVKQIEVNWKHSIALKKDYTIWAWGENEFGQLGDGTKERRLEPQKILENVESISLSGLSSLALKNDGTLWFWGKMGSENKLTPIMIMDDVKLSESD